MSEQELEKYFTMDKSNWYTLDDRGRKEWKMEKVAEFWKRIREKGNNNFNNYKFPIFEQSSTLIKKGQPLKEDENFWKAGEKQEFTEDVNFFAAMFEEKTHFTNIVFRENVFFTDAFFAEDVIFDNTTFSGMADFAAATFGFGKKALFNSTFKAESHFDHATFNEESGFSGSIFEGKVYFNKTNFKEKVDFFRTKFIGDTYFEHTTFEGEVDFTKTIFKNTSVTLFQDLKNVSKLYFSDINFPKTVTFRRVDFTKTSFNQCDLTEVQFNECEWGGGIRVVLANEHDNNLKDYKELESLYRQLKRNFDTLKNWELSGKAYRSEMLIRRYRLHSSFIKNRKKTLIVFDINFWEWLFYLIYGRSSGFTQSFLTPFLWIIITIILFAFIFFHLKYKWSEFIECFPDALQVSLASALPLFKTKIEGINWWLSSLETFICSILLVFFILALRKRFKQ